MFLGEAITRDTAKELFFKLLYSQRHHYKKERDLFIYMFPSVQKVFDTLAGSDYKSLSVLLQRIESYLILEIVCDSISKERPTLPIFTTHDNIATIKGNEDYVANVIKSVLKHYIGSEPSIRIEPWS